MYRLLVFYEGSTLPRETITIHRASEVLTSIPELLQQNSGCHRIEVFADNARLFAVDCHGNTLAPE
jgi:hypothetical protein